MGFKARNLETGNVMNVGKDFIATQPKPYISLTGKYYENGIWVEEVEKPLSKAAQAVIEKAKQPEVVPTEKFTEFKGE